MTELAGFPDDGARAGAAARARREPSRVDEADRLQRQVLVSDGVHWELHLVTGRWWCSPDLHRLLGLRSETPVAATPFERCVAEDRPRIDDACAQAIDQNGGFTLDLRLPMAMAIAAGGAVPPACCRVPAACPNTWPGVLREVHADKQALLNLEADGLLAASARWKRPPRCTSSTPSGRADFFVSDRICTLLGYPKGTPAPAREVYFSWVHPEDRALLQAEIRHGQRGGPAPGSRCTGCATATAGSAGCGRAGAPRSTRRAACA